MKTLTGQDVHTAFQTAYQDGQPWSLLSPATQGKLETMAAHLNTLLTDPEQEKLLNDAADLIKKFHNVIEESMQGLLYTIHEPTLDVIKNWQKRHKELTQPLQGVDNTCVYHPTIKGTHECPRCHKIYCDECRTLFLPIDPLFWVETAMMCPQCHHSVYARM